MVVGVFIVVWLVYRYMLKETDAADTYGVYPVETEEEATITSDFDETSTPVETGVVHQTLATSEGQPETIAEYNESVNPERYDER